MIVCRLTSRLYAELMVQESWKDEMRAKTREAIQRSGGISELTLDELVLQLTKYGYSSMTDELEADTKNQIRRLCYSER